LCEVNVSNLESQEDLNNRVKAAAFIGTLQASYTDFHYLRDIWKRTTEKDALIGVGMTGIASGAILKLNMKEAAQIVKEENERVAKVVGINKAARCTTIKPSGTTSMVLGTSSGVHAWHDNFYIRRMRLGKNEALYTYLYINHPELVEDEYFKPQSQAVVSVPQKAPEGAITRSESAVDLLHRLEKLHKEWIKPGHRTGRNTHNVSVTISLKPEEWPEVGEWAWANRNNYTALSCLPYDNGSYVQAPFETITEEKFNEIVGKLHEVDLSKVIEVEDNTDQKGELACAGGACEII
jgi:ribonucleoside-diphosphate reductase alpha chain